VRKAEKADEEGMFEVEKINYAELVAKMERAENIKEYLQREVFQKLPAPKWQNEKAYFWIALAKAARNSEKVWLWFTIQPHLRHLVPCSEPIGPGQFVDKLVLPEIGGPDDKPYVMPEKTKICPRKFTKDDFRKEEERLSAMVREQAGSGPEACQTLEEWVKTFSQSGCGQFEAMLNLAELGFEALSTPEGVMHLVGKYSPKNKNSEQSPQTI